MSGPYSLTIPSISGVNSTNPFVQLHARANHIITILGFDLNQEASIGSAQVCLIWRRRTAGCTLLNAAVIEPLTEGGTAAGETLDTTHNATGLASALAGSTTKIPWRFGFNVLNGLNRRFLTTEQLTIGTVGAEAWLTLEFLAAPPAGTIWSGQILYTVT